MRFVRRDQPLDGFFRVVNPLNRSNGCGELHLPRAVEMLLLRGDNVGGRPPAVRHSYGGPYGDVIWTSWPGPLFVHERVVELLRRHAIGGWSDFPATVVDRQRVPVPDYSGLAVTGRCGPIEFARAAPAADLGAAIPRGYLFDPASWDGSDLFLPERSMSFPLATGRVRRLFEEHGIANARFQPLVDVPVDPDLRRGDRPPGEPADLRADTAVELMLAAFPELDRRYRAGWGDPDWESPGPVMVAEQLLAPYLTELLGAHGADAELARLFAFAEELVTHPDLEVRQVVGWGVCGTLAERPDLAARARRLAGPAVRARCGLDGRPPRPVRVAVPHALHPDRPPPRPADPARPRFRCLSPFSAVALTGRWRRGRRAVTGLFEGAAVPTRPPLVEAASGRIVKDFVWTNEPSLPLVGRDLLALLQTHRLTGWATYPVAIIGQDGAVIDGFRGLAVPGGDQQTPAPSVGEPPPDPEPELTRDEHFDPGVFFVSEPARRLFIAERVAPIAIIAPRDSPWERYVAY